MSAIRAFRPLHPIAKLRPVDRAPEHLQLVAKDRVLELKLRDAPASGEDSEEANKHEVGEGSQGPRMLMGPEGL
jgi:hypothetical protein